MNRLALLLDHGQRNGNESKAHLIGGFCFLCTFASNVKRMAKKTVTTKKVAPKKKPAPKKKVVKKKKSGAGPPIGNTNAEKWTEQKAERLFAWAYKHSANQSRHDNDFIGEVAQSVGTTLSVLEYLRGKYPKLSKVYEDIKRNCEANCFRNGKNGTIVPSLAIMNLKSNHGWTDRNTVESNNVNYNSEPLTKEELDEARKAINDKI